MSKPTQDAIDTPEVWVIRVSSYPTWSKPAAERLQALRVLLKHSGFMPVEIKREDNADGK